MSFLNFLKPYVVSNYLQSITPELSNETRFLKFRSLYDPVELFEGDIFLFFCIFFKIFRSFFDQFLKFSTKKLHFVPHIHPKPLPGYAPTYGSSILCWLMPATLIYKVHTENPCCVAKNFLAITSKV